MTNRVLVLATSIKTKGGITSVIKSYQETRMWSDWNCFWLATHIDKNPIIKIGIYLKSIILFILIIPFYSIVHIHFSEPTTAFRKYPFVKLSKTFGKRIIIHFHSFSIESTINGNYEKRYHRIFVASDKILVLSEQWKKWLGDKWPEIYNKIEVVYNPCQPVNPKDRDKKKVNTIIYAGALNSRKGYADLINSFSKIAYKYPEWKLELAGNGELDNAKLLIENLQLSQQVYLKGWISGKSKEEFFSTASIFCLPSYAEGFPMAVLDAWAYGVPVITTPVGGLPDILIDKQNALVFRPGDTNTLSQILDDLISDEELRKNLSKASLKLSNTKFNLHQITTKIDQIYHSLINA